MNIYLSKELKALVIVHRMKEAGMDNKDVKKITGLRLEKTRSLCVHD